MYKGIDRRIDQLEARAQPPVYGVRWLNAEWQGKDPNVVKVPKTGETLSLEAFEQRYPAGVVINVTYDKGLGDMS